MRRLSSATAASAAVVFTVLSAAPTSATVAGANGLLAFEDAENGGIYTIDPESGDEHRVSPPDVADMEPSWSPDGTKIAFLRDGQVWVMSSTGEDATRLTDHPTQLRGPAWSPDGERIAFWSIGDIGDIYVMNWDGTGRINLTRDPENFDFDPAWSPDGTRIAFGRQDPRSPSTNGLYVMQADGSGITRLTEDFYAASPSWSPTGDTIVYGPDSTGGGTDTDVWLVTPDGRSRSNLTGGSSPVSGTSSDPVWSPDGASIAFVSGSPCDADSDCTRNIYVMNADGTNLRPLTSSGINTSPDWQALPPSPSS